MSRRTSFIDPDGAAANRRRLHRERAEKSTPCYAAGSKDRRGGVHKPKESAR